jgi:hypothetical protein
VYVKLREYQTLSKLLTITNGERSIRHGNGEITKVMIEEAGVGLKRVRLTNIAPEALEYMIKMALGQYGGVRDIKVGTWARTFRFSVDSVTRILMMTL